MNRLYMIMLVSMLGGSLQAQQFGGNPPSVRYKQINTDTLRVIFPEGLDSQARRVASIIHYEAANQQVPLGPALRKVNLVLQNQTVVPNAYVGLGPFRSEFFLTPPANNFDEGSIAWADMLAVHEYRHVQQFNNFHRGLSNLLYHLFGDDGYSLAIDAAVPDWFYEGDAVYNETQLSQQGRGRLPLFLNSFPALWDAHKDYSWMKLRNGSWKDYVPDHYNLGYLLVNYGREKYGLDFWSKVTQDASAYKGLIYPFQTAVKKYTGIDYATFKKQAFAYYQKAQQEHFAGRPIIDGTELYSSHERNNTSYEFPYQLGDDSLLYVKTGYQQRAAFYLRDRKGEHLIRVRDPVINDQFSYRNGQLVYAAYANDPRWGWKDYSDIKLVDIKTGHERSVTHHTKYFSPDLSPDGTMIAAVQVSTDSKSELHILDAATGKLITAIRSAEILSFTDPKFIDNKTLVTPVRLKDGKMALALADITTGNTVRITAPSFNVMGYPCVDNGMVYFTASFEGNDEIFRLRLGDKQLSLVTSSRLGNYFVNARQGKLVWSSFTADGYRLRELSADASEPVVVPAKKIEELSGGFPVSHDEEVADILNKVAIRQFPVTKYKKGTRLVNFHSWRPYYEDPEFTFSLYGENILNTLQTEIYYLYNRDDRTSAVGANVVYGALFPYLSAGVQHTFDRQQAFGNRIRHWDEVDTRIGINIPLNWISGKTVNQFNIGTNYYYRNDLNKGFFKDSIGNINFSYLQHYLSFGQQSQMALQEIFPRFGYGVSLQHRYAITNYKSWQFLGSAAVYLPGLVHTHSLLLTGAYQETDTSTVLFGNQFPYSRGYNPAYFSRMWKLSANYHFPIVYPDWGFANILYLQRVRGNLFYDFTKVYSLDKSATANQRSLGGEVFVDTKWWNQYPLTFGFRVSRLLDNDFYSHGKATVFEFVLPVSIFPR